MASSLPGTTSSSGSLQGFFDRVQACNNTNGTADYVDFCIGGSRVGCLTTSFVENLRPYKDVFSFSSSQQQQLEVALQPHLDTADARTEALAGVLRQLRDSGAVQGWRNELYPVVGSFGAEPACLIERAAAVYFGIKAYGVHVNGYVEMEGGLQLWVARRSRSKPTWPGKLDHIVAGGQPHGISCAANVVKECEEEASIPAALAAAARPAGAVSYAGAQPQGLKRDVLFVYDLRLPPDFVPTPQDGEVEEFMLLPIEEVADLVATTTQFKDNCCLVIIDFLVRHGYLTPDQPRYAELVAALRQGDCT